MIRILGAGTLSILVVVICLIFGIITRPKPVDSVKSVSFENTFDNQATLPEQPADDQLSNQGQVAGAQAENSSNQTVKPATGEKYTVQSGDTLYGIGIKFNKDWKEIAAANDISDSGSLHEGQELIIP